MAAHVRADAGLPPWTLGLPRASQRSTRSTHAEAPGGRARAHLEVARPARRRHPARPPGRSARVGEDPGSHQGGAAQALDRGVLSPTSASRPIAAVAVELWRSGGATGQAALLSALGGGHATTCSASASAASGRASAPRPGDVVHVSFPIGIHPVGQLGAALGRDGRPRHDLGRGGDHHAVGGPARTDPEPEADASSRRCRAMRSTSPTSPRRSGIDLAARLGQEAAGQRRAADRRPSAQARARVGRRRSTTASA